MKTGQRNDRIGVDSRTAAFGENLIQAVRRLSGSRLMATNDCNWVESCHSHLRPSASLRALISVVRRMRSRTQHLPFVHLAHS